MYNVRKAHQRYDSSSVGSLLTPGFRAPPPKNFHRENIITMQRKEMEIQKKNEPKAQESIWKMKRF